MENSIFPLIRTMDKKLEIDLRIHDKMEDVSAQLRKLESATKQEQTNSRKRAVKKPAAKSSRSAKAKKDSED